MAAETEAADLERDRERADADVEQVRHRRARDQQRLDTGAVSSPRELENLQSEIASLQRRQADLEDAELEVMERLEEVQRRLAQTTVERERVAAQAAEVQRGRDEAWAEMDGDADDLRRQREAAVRDVPDALRELYEKLRAQHGGVGAAPLRQRSCEGCRLELDPADLARIRSAAPDAVLRCEQCRRILVRTSESGL